MEEQQFEKLTLANKARVVWENGKFLESIISYYNYKINLYSLHHKFVEVYCRRADNEIVKISMASEKDMKKYISRIVISNIF